MALNIPPILDTHQFRHLALTGLNTIINEGPGGSSSGMTFAQFESYAPALDASIQSIISQLNGTINVSATLAGGSTSANQTNGTQKTQIVDGSGVVAGTLNAIGQNALAVSQTATYFQLSTVNSTTAQLGAGATFTGTIETIFNQQAASILLTSDQNGTLTVNQYIDAAGARLASSYTYSVTAGVGFSRCVIANGNYFRLTFQNTGGSSTTTLNVNTAFGTLPAATQLGNAPVAIQEIASGVTIPVSLAVNPTIANTSFIATQSTAGNLNATVVGTGTLAVQNTAATPAGTNLIGKVTTSDGTNSITIKPASTASISTDTAQVVALSPNTPLPAGANAIGAVTTTQLASTLGAKTTANSPAFNIASDQLLATGQATMANSQPVVLASDQMGPQQVAASLSSTMARKLQITGFASAATSTTYANLLDPSAGTAGTDVRDYNTALITIVSTATTGSYIIKGSFDSAGSIGQQTLQIYETTITSSPFLFGAITPTATTRTFQCPIANFNYLWFNLSTGISSGTIQVYVTLSQAMPVYPVVGLPSNASVNMTMLNGSTPINSKANGSGNNALGVIIGSNVANTDQTATAYAGAGRVNGTTVASGAGGGMSISGNIAATVTTLGTATALIPILQESYDGGTTYSDIWTGFPFTTSQQIRVPAIPIAGRRRWALHSVGGTSTTVPCTITAMELPGVTLMQRQFVDVYNATNPFAAVINGNTYASTLVSTTVSSTSAPCIIEGCKFITIGAVFTGGTPVVAPIYSLQVSNDLTNWYTTAVVMTPTAAGTFLSTATNACYKYARLIVTTASSGGTPYGVTYTSIYATQ